MTSSMRNINGENACYRIIEYKGTFGGVLSNSIINLDLRITNDVIIICEVRCFVARIMYEKHNV